MTFTPKFVDLVRNFTASTGTGPVAPGAAVSGYTGIAAALSPGDQFYYCLQSVDKPQEREVGRGTLLADGKIAREPISGALTSFTGGTKTIALVAAAEWFGKLEQEAGSSRSIEVKGRGELALAPPERGPLVLGEGGRHGLFVWDPADLSAMVAADTAQGIYVAPASAPTGVSGAWVRKFSGPVDPMWFGIVEGNAAGANGAANSTAMAAMLATLRARGKNPSTYYLGCETIRFPAGFFEFASTIELTDGTFIVEGASMGFPAGHATIIKFPAGVTGIRVHAYNTSGATGPADSPTHKGGQSIIRNLALRGGFTAAEAEAHGIQLRGQARIEQVYIEEFEGDGIHGAATAGGASNEGNVNLSSIVHSRIQECRDGVYFDGADANAGTVIGVDCSSNRRWGFHDSSFLGNSYIGCHTASNGNSAAANAIAPSTVHYGGFYYGVIAGQEAGASTNAPSGAATTNTWWYYHSAGGPHPQFPDWASGTTYRAGGGYRSDNPNSRSVFTGCYMESDEGKGQIAAPAQVYGGFLASNNIGGAFGFATDTGGNPLFGRMAGPPSDAWIDINNTNYSSGIRGKRWVAGVATTDWRIWSASGQLIYDHTASHRWCLNNIEIYYADATAFRPTTDNVPDLGASAQRWKTVFGYTGDFTTQVKVAGVKVVGAQGAAVADAADAASAITQLNALLARLRAHGLIAA